MTGQEDAALAVLDPDTRRLADRGARELLGMSLNELTRNLATAGESLDAGNIEGLVLAGWAAEEIDRRGSAGAPNAPAAHEPRRDK